MEASRQFAHQNQTSHFGPRPTGLLPRGFLRLQNNLYTIITCSAEYRDKMSAHLLSLLLASVSLAMPTSPNTLYYLERLFTRGGPSIQATDPFDRKMDRVVDSRWGLILGWVGCRSCCQSHREGTSFDIQSWYILLTPRLSDGAQYRLLSV